MLFQLLWVLVLLVSPTDQFGDDTQALVRQIESVEDAELYVFKLKDNRGGGMDCLKVFQPGFDREPGVYYGVYHNFQQRILVTHLARSTDLVNWTHLVELDSRASQPTIHACDNGGYVLAYEHDEPNSVWIRLRYYASLSDLLVAKFQRQFDIPRSLAPTAEGTPSFESVQIGEAGIESSEIRVRFHYYWNGDVDQLASGTLRNFESWNAESATGLNSELRDQGWLGNLGDREKFTWGDESYYLQEVQRTKGDWGSWRIGLCDLHGRLIQVLSIRTPGGSTAFSNPHASWICDKDNQQKLVLTLFLHSKGNPREETGVLLYLLKTNTE
ncbi:MAG: hypothetical protein JNL67_05410 [Planctomycetaceae bacterium]|nr:hypothetical protein [Planctomycetaceae bacterium]